MIGLFLEASDLIARGAEALALLADGATLYVRCEVWRPACPEERAHFESLLTRENPNPAALNNYGAAFPSEPQ